MTTEHAVCKRAANPTASHAACLRTPVSDASNLLLRVKNPFATVRPEWTKCLWILVPLLALLFTFMAGEGWPFHVGAGFPKDGDPSAPPVATSATLFVYSPDARPLNLQAKFRVAEPGRRPSLQVSVSHGKAASTVTAETATSSDGLLAGTAPLRLTRGINAVKLALGNPTTSTAFTVKKARVSQDIFTTGNLLFFLTLSAVATASILVSRALGANGLNAFCAASLIGFLLVATTGTLLSPGHLLTAGTWAVVLLAASLALGVWSALQLGKHPAPIPVPQNTLHPLEAVVLLVLAIPASLMHLLLPIAQWDDLMYHGPRTAYWLQNASALPFVSHDDRLSVFPLGGDLLNACGTILSGSELPGKFLEGLALPLSLFALFALLRNAGVRSLTALGMTVIFAAVPMVTYVGISIKPDLWLILLGITTLHWILVARRGNPTMFIKTVACLAAASAGAAFGVKWTAAPLCLFLPLVVFLPGWRERPLSWLLPPIVTFALALAFGGAGPILWSNFRDSHHPFGPKVMREWHQPDPGLHPVMVQLERLPFILFPPPYAPDAGVRKTLEGWEATVADATGATESLWREDQPGWPGRFVPQIKAMDDGFSLGWVFVFIGGVAGFAFFRRQMDRAQRGEFLLVSALSLVFATAVVTQTRWQSSAGLPDRFLLPALTFGLIAVAGPLDRLIRHGRLAAGLLGALVALHLVPYGVLAVTSFRVGAGSGWETPVKAESVSPYSALSQLLPPGRTILLLADQSSRDYPLFLAREGFANRVLPWGKASYDAAAFERALHQGGVDTVIISSPDTMDMLWDAPLDSRPFVQDMDARPDFQRSPGTGNMAVYLRKL